MSRNDCELCAKEGGEVVFRSRKWRVVLIDDADHPGFCRVIWDAHVGEMTDLDSSERAQLMEAVCEVEAAMRAIMRPVKINLASLGNMVPHLHWHVIARYADDAQFPASVWAAAKRTTPQSVLAQRTALLPQLRAEIVRRLQQSGLAREAV